MTRVEEGKLHWDDSQAMWTARIAARQHAMAGHQKSQEEQDKQPVKRQQPQAKKWRVESSLAGTTTAQSATLKKTDMTT